MHNKTPLSEPGFQLRCTTLDASLQLTVCANASWRTIALLCLTNLVRDIAASICRCGHHGDGTVGGGSSWRDAVPPGAIESGYGHGVLTICRGFGSYVALNIYWHGRRGSESAERAGR